MFCLQPAYGLCMFEPLAKRIDKDRVQPVDAGAVILQDFGGAVRVVCHSSYSGRA